MKKMSKLDRENIQDILALTPMQEGLLFHYLKEPSSDLYFTQLCLEISGKPDIGVFTAAWNFVVKTNEMLRTFFRWENVKNPLQVILKDHFIQLQYIDFSGKPGSEKINRLEKIKERDRQEGFDLREVPFRIILCKLEDARYQVIISNHHILYDGWSNGIILREFFKAYSQLNKGKSITELKLPQKKKFKEFIMRLGRQDNNKEREDLFWKQYLGNFAGEAQVPLKRKKSLEMKKKDRKGTIRYQRCLVPGTSGTLERFAAVFNITPAVLFYTAWGVLLQRYCNSEDVLFGTTVSGRSVKIPGIENMVGLFINTLPLRLQVSWSETIEDVLYKNNRHLQDREAYEHTPLVAIKQYSTLSGSETFFDSLVVVENYPLDQQMANPKEELSLTSYSTLEKTHFDVTIGIHTQLQDKITVDFNCSRDCFDKAAVEQMGRHYVTVLEYMLRNPGKRINEIDILSPAEKKQLVVDFNDTRSEFPREKSLPQLFEEQVERTPDNIAIVGPLQVKYRTHMTYMTYITYRELNEKSNQLAYRLLEKGVGADTIVAIMIERCVEMIVGIMGILKAGGAYLPIDPDYPEERKQYMLADSGARILLTTGDTGRRGDPLWSPCTGNSTISLGGHGDPPLQSVSSSTSTLTSTCQASPANLAYIIYTSGSTGQPKGVLVEQASVVNLLMALHQCYPLTGNDTFLLKTSYLFDVSVAELFGWVPGGGRLSILVPGGEKNPREIMDTIKKNRVTHINFVPSMFTVFTSVLNHGNIHKLSSLKYIFLAGEALLPEQVNRFRGLTLEIELENIYGPTEGTVYTSRYSLSQWDGVGSIPIGKPLPNIRLYILDKHDHLQPVGVPGELYISGIGLARGYLNRPELSNQKLLRGVQGGGFLEKSPPGRLYQTGDLACWLPDVNINFLGRIDRQVKIRGYRIELGEIESNLSSHQDITGAVVTALADRTGEYSLCGYIVAETKVDVLSLKQYLARKLPNYMVPSYFVQLDKMPLTSTGKIDRKQLPHPRGSRSGRTGVYTEPKSDLEKRVADIWREILRLDNVSGNENFFDVGGNSLSIIRLNSRLNEVFHKDIPLVTLFKYPTISSLAGYLNEGEESAVESRVKESPHPEERTGKTGVEVAVIGMAGRFPGARNVHEFWENLKSGIESIVFLTEKEAIESDPELVNHTGYIPAKGILEDKNHFDAFFFGYTPAEAKIMDPQVRIFHECCWEALEDAGYNPENYQGLIGLYAGASPNPYWEILPLKSLAGGPSYGERWDAVQFSDKDYMSTRIAYKLDLKGPCVTMQTACSTSLVVVDLACQGLFSGTCDIALAGGASVTFHDEGGYLYQEGTIMSPDGHCRAFDAGANGTVGGNGVGVVVLKHLEEAVKDRDNIYAVIKGFGINNDGKNKVGFTAPSVEGQAKVIAAALRMAGFDPESIGYVEAHGTGTPLGDPIEIEALKHAFAASTAASGKKNYCALGSVKTNIGHLDAAAGIAGLIKTVLILKHCVIPPNLHLHQPNPEIDFENSPFYVNKELKPWQNDEYPLRAGVSSFGLGGTNAHVVLEEAPAASGPVNQWVGGSVGQRISESVNQWVSGSVNQEVNEKRTDGRGGSLCPPHQARDYQLILLSAKTPSALDKMTENLAEHFRKKPDIDLADTAYTLQVGRKAFAHRGMLVCSNPDELVRKIRTGEMETGQAKKEKPTIIFMFSGQGSQYVNMGLDLYREEPVFRAHMDQCFKHLENLTGIDMKLVLYPDKESLEAAGIKIGQFLYTTPIKFSFEYSLAKLLMSWGIHPDAMIGHSFGEYVAACLSGVFSLEDALFLAALRGRLMHGLPDGTMLSVTLPETKLKPLLNANISLAAVNSESMCVVSGPVQVIDTFAKKLNEKGHDCLRYHVPKAGHSRMVEPILEEFKEKIARVKFNNPQIPYISGLTGKWITARETVDPGYWTRHLRETVRFADGLTTLFKEPNPIFLQVGPGRGLTLFVHQHPGKKSETPTLNLVRHRKEKISDCYYTLGKIGQLWLNGVPFDGQRFYSDQKRYRISLPAYPFAGKYYYLPKDILKIDTNRSPAKPLLTHKTDMSDWFYIPVWQHSPLTLTSSQTTQSGETPGSFNWLVFMDDLGLGTRLVKEIRKSAREVVIVKVGEEYTREDKNSYILNPRHPNDYDRLFRELRESSLIPDKTIHLWSVIDNQELEGGIKELDWIQELGLYSLFYMVQAVGRQDISREMQVKVVTNNMQSVTGEEDTCPGKATIRGAVKIIPLEYVNIKCTGIDILLSGPGSGSQIEDKLVLQLLKELEVENDSPENIIALRGNRRWCETMKPCRLEKPDPVEGYLKEKGVYLITGGFGGMGFTFARHLAEDFKAKLILVGRSFFPARQDWTQWLDEHPVDDKVSVKIRQIQEWEEIGAEIMVGNADVSNPEQMQAVITEAHRRFGSINGVLHTAGVGDYAGMIQQRTREMTEQVMAPKVKGTLVLDAVLKDDPLDFLVLFSSIGNIIYQVKFAQVGYSAANEFLEAFAYYKNRKDGTYTVTINWNDWLEVGMSIEAANRKYQKHWRYKTMADPGEIDYESAIHAGITPARGIEIFRRILGRPLERVTVSIVDLDEMVRVLKGLKRKDSSTIEAVEEQVASIGTAPRPPLQTPYLPPANPVEAALCETWCNYFGIESVGTEDDFFELGGDSLKAMIITQKIYRDMAVRIPLADFFNNPTIKELAGYVHLIGAQHSPTEKKIYSSIIPAEKKEYYLLSSAQQRIYILQQMEEKSISYNITHTVLLEGEVDRKRLEETFSLLIGRHESLRTSFHIVGDQPLQKVHDEVEFAIEYDDISEAEAEVKVEEERFKGTRGLAPLSIEAAALITSFIRPFDLSHAPLLRVGLMEPPHTPAALRGHPSQEGKKQQYILMMDTHHIISDGTSVDVLTKEFTTLYKGDVLPGLRLQYKDYSEWQNKKFASDAFKSQEQFWLEEFKKEVQALDLPTDHPRPAEKSYEGSTVQAFLGKVETRAVKTIAMEQGMTLSMVLFSIYAILLSKLTGQEDIVIGLTIFGRQHPDLQQTVGMFVNMLALRTYPCAHKSLGKFLLEVKDKTLEAYENQDYPFEKLVEKAAIKRYKGRNPLFDAEFVLQPDVVEVDQRHHETMDSLPLKFENTVSNFDIFLMAKEKPGGISLNLQYWTKLFKKETIELFLKYYQRIIKQISGNKEINIRDIELMEEDKKDKIIQSLQADIEELDKSSDFRDL